MRHELWKSRKRKQRISNPREMQVTLCFLLHHRRRKIVSVAVEFCHTTRRRAVLREIANATAVINMVTMRKAARKSHMRPKFLKRKAAHGCRNTKGKKNKMLTDWKQNVRNVRPCQTLMTSPLLKRSGCLLSLRK